MTWGFWIGIALAIALVAAVVGIVANWRRRRHAQALNRAYAERQRHESLRRAAGEYSARRTYYDPDEWPWDPRR